MAGTEVITCANDVCLSGPLYPLRIPPPMIMSESREVPGLFTCNKSLCPWSEHCKQPLPEREGLWPRWGVLLFLGLTPPHYAQKAPFLPLTRRPPA